MKRTSWSLIVSGCALAGLTACTPRTSSNPDGIPSATPPRLVDTTELARVPERTFINGLWIRRPPVDFVRRSSPCTDEQPQTVPLAHMQVEAPLVQSAPAAPTPTDSAASPILIEPLKAEGAPTSRAPLATPTTADLAPEIKPERPVAPADAGETPALTQPPTAVPSPAPPQVEEPRRATVVAEPSAVAPAGPDVEAPVYAWSRRSIDEVAGMFAQQIRHEPWVAQARDRLGRPPRVQIGGIDDGSQGALGIERFTQSLGIALQQMKGLDLAPGNPPDYQVVGKVRLSEDRHFVQIDLHVLEIATKQTLQPFATEVPAAGTGAKPEQGKAGYIP